MGRTNSPFKGGLCVRTVASINSPRMVLMLIIYTKKRLSETERAGIKARE